MKIEGQCKVKTRTGEWVWERVTIEVDDARLARELGPKAWASKGRKAVEAGGAVVVRQA